MKAPYQALLEAHGEIALLSSIEDLLAWDNRTYRNVRIRASEICSQS